MTEPSDEWSQERFRRRFRLVACCLVLVALAFWQRPGRVVSDTKLDLAVDPAGMLARSLHLWDPEGWFGQVQNQAYGYLFPLGPFSALGQLLSVPAWVVQRAWWSLLLVTAFLGVVALCRALRIGTPMAAVLAGFAYALSPRVLTTIGPISVEAWPLALAPWVLVPLVVGARRGSPRRAAAASALAVAAVGGVNAAATFAVIPLGAVWLLTRTSGPRRRTLMVWWPVLVLLGTAWWLVPLLLLGRYSPPFLEYIESSSVTTVPTTLFDSLRGTSHWIPYVESTWLAGNDLLTEPLTVLNSAVLLLLGVTGLALRSNPHRQFLVLGLLLGLLMVTAGHGGAVQGWFAAEERAVLDTVLAPLRNVHKFDAVVRLPLVLGLAHVIGRVAAVVRTPPTGAAPRRQGPAAAVRTAVESGRVTHAGVALLAAAAVVGAATPAVAGRLAPANDFTELPPHWQQVADWLEERDDGTVALLVPGSSFAFYTWGDSEDEPLQPLATTRWAVRNAVPLAPSGNIRMLDAIEERLAAGRPSPGLAGFLARAGISRLVVRNDLRVTSDVPHPLRVHQALEGSPGIERVATFGPLTDGSRRGQVDGRPVVDLGTGLRYRAVEIYEVEGQVATARATGEPPVVVGGPESLLDLADAGLVAQEPTVLAADLGEAAPTGPVLLTDGLRRQEVNVARIHTGRSATLTADDDGRRGAPSRDYTLGTARWETTASYVGARDLRASGSRAFADTAGEVLSEHAPFAALDGLVETSWRSGAASGSRPWLEVELDEPRTVGEVTVVAGGEEDDPDQSFTVRTDTGTSEVVTVAPGGAVSVVLPEGATSRLRLTGAEAREVDVAELRVPGLDVDRTLVLPQVPAAWGAPAGVTLTADEGRSGCAGSRGRVRCLPGTGRGGEEPGVLDRTLRLGAGGRYEVAARVRPVGGEVLSELVQQDQLVGVEASSRAHDDPRASALAAVDGDPGTTWVAAPEDRQPTLTLRWLGDRSVSGFRVDLDSSTPAGRPGRVLVSHADREVVVELDERGVAAIPPVRTDRLVLTFLDVERTVVTAAGGDLAEVGVGVSEVEVVGADLFPMRLSTTPVDTGCGSGPAVRVGETLFATTVTASPRQLLAGDEVPARLCAPAEVWVPAGETRVVAAPSAAFRAVQLVLTSPDHRPGGSVPVRVGAASPTHRTLTLTGPLADGSGVMAMTENTNPGWRATGPVGPEVDPVVVDGWRQGWRVPADVSELAATFAPDGPYRAGLAVGAASASALLMLTVSRVLRRRDAAAPALTARALPALALAVLGAAALGMLGGWAGLLAGCVGAAAAAVTRRLVDDDTAALLSGAPLVVAGALYWLRPLGSPDGWAGAQTAPQLLVAVALGALVFLADAPGSRRASTGRSTSR